jgi:hypothetical protein
VDIRRNVEAVRNAIKWGMRVDGTGMPDVPDSPPAPFCKATNESFGSDTAIIAVRWENNAEGIQFVDGSGSIFYNGLTDLSGYRIYRGNDKRGIWDLIADIPRADFGSYWNTETERYEYFDKTIQFGFEYSYYVQSYFTPLNEWVSADGTQVPGLGELASGDHNRTALITARPGPVEIDNGWDVFVAPNPFIDGDPSHSFPNSNKIEFRNLPERAKINIYSVSGDLVRSLRHGPDELGNLAGSIDWDQRSDSGLLVAPGLYVYVIESETEGTIGSRTQGKLMIIR